MNYSLSVIDLAIPSPRVGSIDTYSGFGKTSDLAIKAHQSFQLNQQKNNPNYYPEVTLFHSFPFKRVVFQITGRMDGIYQEETFRIEEIKTAFESQKLIHALKDSYFTHPYWLQLQIYGYIHWLKTNQIPALNLLIISLRNKKTHTLPLEFNKDAFEHWLENRFADLLLEIKESKKQCVRRKKEALKLVFPFPQPRAQQKELMDCISQNLQQKKPMLIQAPTGLGKSVGVLYPTLQESLNRGQKTLYLTPKNSQHQIAVDTLKHFQAKGSSCKTLVLTAKKKLCMKNEPLCNSTYCEFAQEHYTKCTEHDLFKKIKKKQNLNSTTFKDMAIQYQVCPYELQMESIPFVDVVIADYNYVFSPSSANSRVVSARLGEQGKPNLVMDEVHNLPSRSMDYYSPSLSTDFFAGMQHRVEQYPQPFQKQLKKALLKCINTITQCANSQARDTHLIHPPVEPFKKQDEVLNQLLSDYLESDLTIEAEDPILKLCHYWSDFTAALEGLPPDNGAFFTSFNPGTRTLKMTCCDASDFLKEHYNNFQHIIGFSATLKPFAFYSQLIGLHSKKLHTQEFATPFSPQRRKLLLIPQVSTKYKERAAHYPKLIEVITRITTLNPGNYFIFFPSFEFLDHVFRLIPSSLPFTLLRQNKNMHPKEAEVLLKQLHQPDKHHLIFAVQGGMFAEGIDYVGDLAIGAFIVGPPLPLFDWEREQMKHYYEAQYNQGIEYAYIYPAMAKSIQAAGRVIRTETDKGIIVLLDNRFLNPAYSNCMPDDWFIDAPHELISKSILKDINLFWNDEELLATTD